MAGCQGTDQFALLLLDESGGFPSCLSDIGQILLKNEKIISMIQEQQDENRLNLMVTGKIK
jgi:hypothetical protein